VHVRDDVGKGRVPLEAKTPILAALGVAGADGKLFLPAVQRDFFEGAKAYAETRGYEFEACVLEEDTGNAASIARRLRYRGVLGVMVMPPSMGLHRLPFDFSPFATVALGRALYEPRLHRVSPHHSANMVKLFREVTRRGFKRIGLFLISGMSEQVEDTWLAAYLRLSLRESDVTLPPFLPEETNPRAFRSWLREHRPDAIITSDTGRLAPMIGAGGVAASKIPPLFLLSHRGPDDPPEIEIINKDSMRRKGQTESCRNNNAKGQGDTVCFHIQEVLLADSNTKVAHYENRFADAGRVRDDEAGFIRIGTRIQRSPSSTPCG